MCHPAVAGAGCYFSEDALEMYILALSQMFLLKLIWRYKNEYKEAISMSENLSKH